MNSCKRITRKDLNTMELTKYDLIENYVKGSCSKSRTIALLNCTERTFYNLVKKYKNIGISAFSHGNKDRKPSTTFSTDLNKKIVRIYNSSSYEGANILHFQELLLRNFSIKVSYYKLYNLLKEHEIYSPKEHHATTRSRNKIIREKIKNNLKLTEKEIQIVADTNLDDNISVYHPRKERAKYFGELVQMDACLDYWVPNTKWTLHAAIDDATGSIVGLYFDLQETLNGYYNIYKQILENYGIPVKFLTDNRTVFNYNRLADKNKKEEKDTMTQFQHACHQFGTHLVTSSIPQVKGRVERLFNTLLSRLPVELRIANITTMKEANTFLHGYIKTFNKCFSVPFNYTQNAFDKQVTKEQINYYLSIICERKVDNGSSIKYKNKTYMFYLNGSKVAIKPNTRVVVVNAFDDSLLATINEEFYELIELKQNKESSYDLDVDIKPLKQSYKGHKPDKFHPWTYFSQTRKHKRLQA